MNFSLPKGNFVAATLAETLPNVLMVLSLLIMLMNIYFIFIFFRKKSRLGTMQLSAINSIIYTDFFSQLIIFLPFLMLFGFGLFSGDVKSLLEQVSVQFLVLPAAMVFYLAYCLLQAFCKKGFYDGGVMTSKGPLEYKEITAYRLSVDYQAKKLKIIFNPRGKSTSNTAYLVVDEELTDVIKAFLRKHCNLKSAPTKKAASSNGASPSLFKRKKAAEQAEESKGIRPEKKPKKKKSKKK